MFFAQIIAFILVMVLFEAYQPGKPTLGLADSLMGCAALLILFWALARVMVRAFLGRVASDRPQADPARSAKRLEGLLHGLAIVCFVAMVMPLDLKAHLVQWPPVTRWQSLSGLCAALLYLANLLVVWWSMHPVERRVFLRRIDAWPYVLGQARFVAPVVFPWFIAVILRDALAALWPSADAWLETSLGDLFFLAVFLLLISLLFPPLVRRWWNCRPIPSGRTRHVAQTVLDHVGVRVAEIVDWPILEGRVLTAGVLGLAPRLRYLLITEALAESLTEEQMAAVVAHEAGHVKHWHVFLYLLFFMGFFVIVFAMSGPLSLGLGGLLYLLSGTEWGIAALSAPADQASALGLLTSLPMVIFLAVYLRFGMGFFMRHFERQADLFSVRVVGGAQPLIGALERISYLSGNIRDVPSWHHFSVAQRVEAMRRAESDSGYIRQHSRMLRRGLAIYLAVVLVLVGLGLGIDYSPAGENMHRALLVRLLEDRAAAMPNNARLRMQLGVLRYEMGQERRALADLRSSVAMNPGDPEALNSLAWLLVTAEDQDLRDPAKGLDLAQEAVKISPKAHIWDTLAEAYFVNGQPDRAESAAWAALESGPEPERRQYFKQQYQRFKEAAAKGSKP